MEFTLSNTVHAIFNMNAEMFITTWSFQRYGKVAHLQNTKQRMGKRMINKCNINTGRVTE